jgi:hypothetical protein
MPAHDRATALTVISSSGPRAELQRQIEDLIRDEIADVERQVAAERNDGGDQ